MLDMMKMMGKMKEVQARLKEAQDNLGQIKVDGESGGGMVKATVNGKRQLIALDIDSSILNSQDKAMVQDLVIAAVNKASNDAETQARDQLKKATEGMIPNIPGMDFSNLMG